MRKHKLDGETRFLPPASLCLLLGLAALLGGCTTTASAKSATGGTKSQTTFVSVTPWTSWATVPMVHGAKYVFCGFLEHQWGGGWKLDKTGAQMGNPYMAPIPWDMDAVDLNIGPKCDVLGDIDGKWFPKAISYNRSSKAMGYLPRIYVCAIGSLHRNGTLATLRNTAYLDMPKPSVYTMNADLVEVLFVIPAGRVDWNKVLQGIPALGPDGRIADNAKLTPADLETMIDVSQFYTDLAPQRMADGMDASRIPDSAPQRRKVLALMGLLQLRGLDPESAAKTFETLLRSSAGRARAGPLSKAAVMFLCATARALSGHARAAHSMLEELRRRYPKSVYAQLPDCLRGVASGRRFVQMPRGEAAKGAPGD